MSAYPPSPKPDAQGNYVRVFTVGSEGEASMSETLGEKPQAEQPLTEREALQRLVGALEDLIDDSEGVAGLHRNGDLAPWSELARDGRFPWLAALDDARDLLAQPAEPRFTLFDFEQAFLAWAFACEKGHGLEQTGIYPDSLINVATAWEYMKARLQESRR